MTGASWAALSAVALLWTVVRAAPAAAVPPAAAPAPPAQAPPAAATPAPSSPSAPGGAAGAGVAGAGAAAAQPEVLLGPIQREQVEAAVPSWVQAGVAAKPDRDAARALTAVAPGADVTVLMGTWCSDSRREISRLWHAFDEVGADAAGGPGSGLPFTLHYIGVDETKEQPAAAVAAAGLRYVPTVIVRRDGREVGRIVETSPHGIEVDLLALLEGRASGLITASATVKAEAGSAANHPPQPR